MLSQPASISATFPVNARPKLWIEAKAYLNDEWVLTDPTTVELRVRKPNGVVSIYTYAALEVVRESEGVYSYLLPLTMSGSWVYRWRTTGAVEDATYDFTLTVKRTQTA